MTQIVSNLCTSISLFMLYMYIYKLRRRKKKAIYLNRIIKEIPGFRLFFVFVSIYIYKYIYEKYRLLSSIL